MAQRVSLKPIREFFSESPELSKIFIEIHKHLVNLAPTVYFEVKHNLFYYTEVAKGNFFAHITRKRGKITLWTGGKILPNVTLNPKHPTWGSIKVNSKEQLPAIKAALSMSLDHFLFTVASGQSVSWNAPVPGGQQEKKGDF